MNIDEYSSSFIYPWHLLGLEAVMIPHMNKTSSARITMASKNAQQWEIVKGAEFPKHFTGVETMYGDYTFDTLPIDQDVIVLQVLTKYGDYYGDDYKIKDNQMYTVIYEGTEDKKIGYFEVPSYRFLSRGFGYYTVIENKDLLRRGMRIAKGTTIHRSPVKDGPLYKMGVNANTAYVSWFATDNDACIISDALADKLTVTRFYEYDIPITEDMVPANIFGKEGEHKFFPDIGECVGEDGLLAVLRPIKQQGMFRDYTEESLKKYHPIHDIPYRTTPGAKVVDVQVYTNPLKWDDIRSNVNKDGELEASMSSYGQLAKYQHHLYEFYKKMLAIYDANPNAKFTDKMTGTLAKYALLLPGEARQHPSYNGIKFKKSRQIFNKNSIIPLCLLKITVAVVERPTRGAKITGRHGNKGVVSAVWRNEWMPVDKYGFRADLILNGNAVVDRMNNGQLEEHNFNRLSDLVVMDSKHMPIDEAYDYIINFMMDYEPLYGQLVHEETKWRKEAFVRFSRNYGIFFNVPVTRSNFTEDHLMYLNTKWKYRESRVKWSYPISDDRIRTCISMEDIAIGSTYVFLINKVPISNAVELGYVSQVGVPIKNPGAKMRFISQTAIRFGEDEIRIMMISVSAQVLARMLNICGNSPQDSKAIYWFRLTSPTPCNLRRLPFSDEEIAERSVPIKLVQHILASAGIDITRRAIYEDDML